MVAESGIFAVMGTEKRRRLRASSAQEGNGPIQSLPLQPFANGEDQILIFVH